MKTREVALIIVGEGLGITKHNPVANARGWMSFGFSYDKDKEKNILARLKRQQPANACNKRFSSLLRRMRRLGR